MMSSEDLFARQRQRWATCPDWVQTMILKNICETIKAKMEKQREIQEDRREGFTDDWEAVAAEVQSQMSRRPPHRQHLGFQHAQLHAFRHVQLHRLRVNLPATGVLEPWLEPRITETIHRKLSRLSISPRCRQRGYSTSSIWTYRLPTAHRTLAKVHICPLYLMRHVRDGGQNYQTPVDVWVIHTLINLG